MLTRGGPAGALRWVLGEGAAGRLAGADVLNLFSYSCAIGECNIYI